MSLKNVKKIQHAVPHLDGWAVRGEGNTKAAKVNNTQMGAIDYTKEIVKYQQPLTSNLNSQNI